MELKPCRRGHLSERMKNGRCRECRREYQRTVYIANIDKERSQGRAHYWRNRDKLTAYGRARYAANPEIEKARGRRSREKGIERHMLRRARARALKDGYACTITLADINVPEFCPLLGIKLEMGRGFVGPASPSLDKIRPEIGYVPGNVWVISARANTIKQDATLRELELLTANLRARMWIPIPSGAEFARAENENMMASNAG